MEEQLIDFDKGPLYVSMKEPYAKLENIKKRKGKIVTKRVKGLAVNEDRNMKLIDIELDDKVKKAYVDCVTGSLYDSVTGVCLSTPNLCIVKDKK